jgi:hypothetical protein
VAPSSPYLRDPGSTNWLNQSPNRNCFSPAILHYRRHSAESKLISTRLCFRTDRIMKNKLYCSWKKRQFRWTRVGPGIRSSISDMFFFNCSSDNTLEAFTTSTPKHRTRIKAMEELCVSSFFCIGIFWPLWALSIFHIFWGFENIKKSSFIN